MSVSKVGYSIYMSEVRTRVSIDIMRKMNLSLSPSSKIITNEILRRWNSLPESSKNFYNRKAKK